MQVWEDFPEVVVHELQMRSERGRAFLADGTGQGPERVSFNYP